MELREGNFQCPAHSDTRPSLSIKQGDDGKWLVYCHAGCSTADVLAAAGWTWADIMTANDDAVLDTYVYTDEQGHPLIRVLRTDKDGKGFLQQRWENNAWEWRVKDTRKTLYNLPALLAADKGTTCYIVEGEKDVETLRQHGYLATTSIGGANKWRPEYVDSLRGLSIVLVGDNDDPGRESVERIGQSLTAAGVGYRVAFPKAGMKDVTDIFMKTEGVVDWDAYLEFLEPDTSIFEPLDWRSYEDVDVEWLFKPYVPRDARVLAFGAAGSLKSLFAMWLAAKLTRQGLKVVYFNLEMRPGEFSRRMKQADPLDENLRVFGRFSMNQARHVTQAQAAFSDASLIIIDSWSASHTGQNDNDEIARLDREVFLPLIEKTRATILIIDNTAHPGMDSLGRKVPVRHARGASAKGDKMEIALMFDRPDAENGYRTKLTVEKMRVNSPTPRAVVIETPMDRVEFYKINPLIPGGKEPFWPYNLLSQDESPVSPPSPPPENVLESLTEPANEGSAELTGPERRALARIKDTFKVQDGEPDVL